MKRIIIKDLLKINLDLKHKEKLKSYYSTLKILKKKQIYKITIPLMIHNC